MHHFRGFVSGGGVLLVVLVVALALAVSDRRPL